MSRPAVTAKWPVAADWVQEEQFDEWLSRATRRGGADETPDTVLIWRDETRRPVHAAVTLGRWLALEKASQSWESPRVVYATAALIKACRTKGWRLGRRTLR